MNYKATRVDVVIDLQFGSTGKGALAYLLASYLGSDTVCTAWAPNAGHTTQVMDGRRFVHTMLASSMLATSVQTQLIGPGSVLNIDALVQEAKIAGALVKDKEIVIHPNACILYPRHPEAEKVLVRVGSTMKGSAAAVIEKLWRDPNRSPLARDMPQALLNMTIARLNMLGVTLYVSEPRYNQCVNQAAQLLIEGAQGFSLGHHTRFWPHNTARDVSTAQLFADCRLPFDMVRMADVWGIARTFPIRVANRYNNEGDLVGTSGPCYEDQRELDWERDLDREPELTTVTKLPRRIFDFSYEQIEEACRVCDPSSITLSFCDYIEPKPAIGHQLSPALANIVNTIYNRTGVPVRMLTFGPSIEDAVILDGAGFTRWLTDGNFQRHVMGGV